MLCGRHRLPGSPYCQRCIRDACVHCGEVHDTKGGQCTPPPTDPIDVTHGECIAARATTNAAFRAAQQRAATWEPAPYHREEHHDRRPA